LITNSLPKDLQKKVKKIADILAPYTKRAYLVGGCVRDLILNNKIKDLDIEVYDISPDEFDVLMKKVGALGVGKSFFVYKLDDVDLSLPRVERKIGVGHKAFEVEITDNEKIASKRRDFSMNAMMLNIFTGELLDFWQGRESIEKKEICLIDEKTFKEDSLRVLRAVQFAARFGFDIEYNTLHVMQNIDLNDLSKTRVFWEFEKLFGANHLDIGFTYMCKLGLFEKFFSSTPKSIKSIEYELRNISFVEDLRVYYYLYIVANICEHSPYDWAKKLEAPNHYLRAYKNQPYMREPLDDKELKIIAIDMPIRKWLGNYKLEIQKRAKELGIWNECFSGGVTIKKVIEDGFEKEEIKKEYKRRVFRSALK